MKDIKQYLRDLGIPFKEFTHPPVYTCEEAEKYDKDVKGIRSKNLFVKDRKSKNYYLVVLPASKMLNLEWLGETLSEKIKFANETDLNEVLGLSTGAVSPFGLINDEVGKVKLVINKEVWDSDFVSFHSNINTETLELATSDFQKYVKSLKNEMMLV